MTLIKRPVVMDLETKFTFRKYSKPEQLQVSVVAIYDYRTGKGKVFTEDELSRLFPILEGASYIVGFNSDYFDLPVLQPYYPGKVASLSSFDMLEDIRRIIGRRIGLNDIASATLNKGKTGNGLKAVEYFKEGRWEELKKYCLNDVLLTKEIFEYGVKNREIFYQTVAGKTAIPVDWSKYFEGAGEENVPLTLPF